MVSDSSLTQNGRHGGGAGPGRRQDGSAVLCLPRISAIISKGHQRKTEGDTDFGGWWWLARFGWLE